MRQSFVFKLYPTRQQAAALTETLETHRQLCNRALGERKASWATRQRSLSYSDQSAGLKAQRTANPYVARANYSACQRTLKRLDRAFAAFFRRLKSGDTPGYPRFRGVGRFHTVDYTHRDGSRFFGTSLYVQHVGRVKTKQHRPTAGTIKTVGVTRRADGWHCVVVCDLGAPTVMLKDGPACASTRASRPSSPPRTARQWLPHGSTGGQRGAAAGAAPRCPPEEGV